VNSEKVMSQDKSQQNELFDRGLAIRREVLGKTYVDQAIKKAASEPFLLPVQQLATEFAWGALWSRPGLERKIRSFLSMAFLAANGEYEELRSHVRGAVNNGATREEICEVLLHAGAYCGLPVALHSTRVAKEVLDEMSSERQI
jgi:4-carboxymuconolactone decarboxylase